MEMGLDLVSTPLLLVQVPLVLALEHSQTVAATRTATSRRLVNPLYPIFLTRYTPTNTPRKRRTMQETRLHMRLRRTNLISLLLQDRLASSTTTATTALLLASLAPSVQHHRRVSHVAVARTLSLLRCPARATKTTQTKSLMEPRLSAQEVPQTCSSTKDTRPTLDSASSTPTTDDKYSTFIQTLIRTTRSW